MNFIYLYIETSLLWVSFFKSFQQQARLTPINQVGRDYPLFDSNCHRFGGLSSGLLDFWKLLLAGLTKRWRTNKGFFRAGLLPLIIYRLEPFLLLC